MRINIETSEYHVVVTQIPNICYFPQHRLYLPLRLLDPDNNRYCKASKAENDSAYLALDCMFG